MSKIALSGDASGTGTFTIASPNSNSNYTLTLPAASGTLLTSASQLSISGSAPSGSLAIDAFGRVTTPYQPAVNARLSTNVAYSPNAVFNPSVINVNIGSHYSSATGLFTAPVAGIYQLTATLLVRPSGTSSTYMSASPKVNGSNNTNAGAIYAATFSTENSAAGTFLVQLAANDTLGLNILGNATVELYGTESWMTIRLVG